MPIVADGALPNKILIGKNPDAPLYSYGNADLMIGSIKGTFNCDIISNELPIDTFSFGVYYDENQDKVYLTKDTRQAYVCAGYVPGTQESCGWIESILQPRNIGETVVEGNTVAILNGYDPILGRLALGGGITITPPSRHGQTPKFHAGDVVKFRISAEIGRSGWDVFVATGVWGVKANIAEETGFFWTINYPNQNVHAHTSTTDHPVLSGEDVLTITYLEDSNSPITIYMNGTTSVTISGMEFNGEMIYGNLNGENYDQPPLIYILSKRGNVPAKKYLKNIKYGTPVWWFCDDYLQGKGYLQTVKHTGTNTWNLTSMSAIGLLDEKIHTGGYYTGQTFDTVLKEIVGNSFKYEYATGNESISDLAVFGWLPYDTARNNLHRLLFSMGATIKRVDNQ